MVVVTNRRRRPRGGVAGRANRTPARVALALGAVLMIGLAGCSWLGLGGDDKPKPPGDQSQPLTTDEPYPNLAEVPGRPTRPPAIDREKIAQGLAADRENAEYTEDQIRRAPEPPPLPRQSAAARPVSPPAAAAPAPAPAAPAAPPPVAAAAPPPPAPEPAPPPVATAAPPAPATPQPAPPPVVAAAPPPPPAAESPPPLPYAAAPPPAAPAPEPAPPLPYATAAAPPPAPAAAPIVSEPSPADATPPVSPVADPREPSVRMVNNKPVISQGYYATQPPPAPAPAQSAAPPPAQAETLAQASPPPPAAVAPAAPAPMAALDPLQQQINAPPPIAAAESKADPTLAARADSVPVRPTAPPAVAPPPAPADIAPIPNVAPPAVVPAPASPPQVAAAPSAAPGLDEALRRTFPDAAAQRSVMPMAPPRQGVDALAASIYFADGSAGLTEDDRSILREVARLHRERGGTVRVVGYASPEGRGPVAARRIAALDMSSRRAEAVSRELARFGVAAGAITSSAEGTPAGPGAAGGGFGAAGERRVDIYLDY